MTASSRSETTVPRPLKGLRVLDLSRVLAGPYCSMLLADLGADVIKIERRGEGDETRGWGPPYQGGESSYFLTLNRGKRSCELDLSDPGDRGLALDLGAEADVVIENFLPGRAEKLGVGFEDMRRRNPDVIYCSVSGFGSARQPSDRPGYDFLAQAESGMMAATGSDSPTKVGVAIIDVIAGQQLTIALLAALRARDRGEAAQRIEVSLLDAGIAAMVNVAANSLATGEEPRRWGNAHPNIVPYQTFGTASGEIAVAVGNDRTFRSLCKAMGLDEIGEDPRFATNSDRLEHVDELIPILAERFREESADEWISRLEGAGVPVGRIRGVLDAIRAAEAAGESPVFSLRHPVAGDLELVKSPFRINGVAPRAEFPPPTLGQHTAEIRSAGWKPAA